MVGKITGRVQCEKNYNILITGNITGIHILNNVETDHCGCEEYLRMFVNRNLSEGNSA